MTTYERYCKIRDEKGLKDSTVASGTGIGKSTFSDWKTGRSKPKNDKLQKIADYLGVSVDYLTTGNEGNGKELSKRDERDIEKDLEQIMSKLTAGEKGPTTYGGQELSEESVELFKGELEIALRRLKLMNKEKYNPNKNKE